MTIEVVRVLVYTYRDEEAAQGDMARWEMPVEGKKDFFPQSKCIAIESMIHTMPKRTGIVSRPANR